MVRNLSLSGPGSVAPGGTAQLTLIADLSDGTTQDVTSGAAWSSTNTSVATVSNGLVSGHRNGEVTVTGAYTPPGQPILLRTTQLVITPEGTFRILGRVIESGYGQSLAGARVDAKPARGASLSATTLSDGRFAFYGLSGSIEIRVNKTGYAGHFMEMVLTDHRSVDVSLVPVAPIPSVEGSYTLTITTSGTCRDKLPEPLRVRTYTAQVLQAERAVIVQLSNVSKGWFRGFTGPGLVSFELYGDPYYYFGGPEVMELIDGNQLVLEGTVEATPDGERLSGRMNGTISLRQNRNTWLASCWAQDHGFEMVKR